MEILDHAIQYEALGGKCRISFLKEPLIKKFQKALEFIIPSQIKHSMSIIHFRCPHLIITLSEKPFPSPCFSPN